VSDEVVAAYRLPQLVRGWEAGLVRFLLARVTDTRSFGSRVAAAFHGREHLTQIERLVDAVVEHRIPARRQSLHPFADFSPGPGRSRYALVTLCSVNQVLTYNLGLRIRNVASQLRTSSA
jgi:hypothetical protein